MLKDKSLYNTRLKRYKKVVNLEEPDSIPVEFPFTTTYAIEYAGYPLKVGTWDVEKVGKSLELVFQDFDCDFSRSLFYRSPQFYMTLGAKTFVQNEEGYMQHPDVQGLKAEEYPEFIEDPFKTIVQKVIPRLYTELDNLNPYNMIAFAKGIFVHQMIFNRFKEIQKELMERFSVPFITAGVSSPPFDFISDFLRGFNGISIDVRRCPEKVNAACEATLPLMIKKGMLGPKGVENAVFLPLHMPPFLRTSDFEKLYWPTFKKLCEELTLNGYYLNIFFEGDWTRYLDYLSELPRKKIIGRFEYGDPKLFKEKLGKIMCIEGFFELSLLRNGTKQECIKRIDTLINTLAPNGGYIFCTDKMIIKKDDINIENLKAVIDYIRKEGNY